MSLNAAFPDVTAALAVMKLDPGTPYEIVSLSGGVSCDVFLVRGPSRSFVVKRALPKLRATRRRRAAKPKSPG